MRVQTRPGPWLGVVGWILTLWVGLSASAVLAVDSVDLHELNWYVHVDLVTPTEDLAYWQNLLDEQMALANALIVGGQGPVDTPCCSRLARSTSVSVFGTPGDGYDVIDSEFESNSLNNFGGAGSNAYLVDSITYCGGVVPGSIGCAIMPACNGNPNDDPNLWMAATVDAYEDEILPLVIAHERGHNACLEHTSTHACQVMQDTITTPGMGGCFTATECSNFRDGRTTPASGEDCSCHSSPGVKEPDGQFCPDYSIGICSGGLCGESTSDAVVKLIASAHPGSAGIPAPDDALVISALSGDWNDDLGQISPTAEDIQGLAYARDSGLLFGVAPTIADDSIVTVNPFTGNLIAIVGTIANGSAELISMAYHPGLTSSPSDDRLIMMEATGGYGTLIWIDPAQPSVRNEFGQVQISPSSEFKGLAYDSAQGKLFAATGFSPNGLYEIDLTSCPPSPCSASQVPNAHNLFRSNASLAYAPQTGMLYQVGTSFSGSRAFYNVIDPTDGSTVQTISLDELTPGGLAAVPEPSVRLALLVGCAALLYGCRGRRLAAGVHS